MIKVWTEVVLVNTWTRIQYNIKSMFCNFIIHNVLTWLLIKRMPPIHFITKEVLASFKPPNWQRAKARFVLGGKGRVQTQDLGTWAERATNCATTPVSSSTHVHSECSYPFGCTTMRHPTPPKNSFFIGSAESGVLVNLPKNLKSAQKYLKDAQLISKRCTTNI